MHYYDYINYIILIVCDCLHIYEVHLNQGENSTKMLERKLNIAREYLNEVRLRSSKTFNISTEDVHVGHTLLQVWSENLDELAQIDAGTGDKRTWRHISQRALKLCKALTAAGLRHKDIIFMAVPNHADTCIPMYTGLINGYPTLAVDVNFSEIEFGLFLALVKPKIIFCVKQNAEILRKVTKDEINLIVLDDLSYDMDSFISKFKIDGNIDNFTPPLFDSRTPAFLVTTSGTTGVPKVAIIMHSNILRSRNFGIYFFERYPKSTELLFLMSPPQWITCPLLTLSSALLVFPVVQTMLPLTTKTCSKIFAKYKPTFTLINPNRLMELFYSDQCDMSNLQYVLVGGSAVSEKLNNDFKSRYPNCQCLVAYAMTEFGGAVMAADPNGPLGNIGVEFPNRYQYKLVDPDSGLVVTGPNAPGELWVKDSSPFGGYYMRDEETKRAYSSDGFFKTGDILRRDANGFYFFVDRLKTLLKYRGIHVYPSEIENLLRQHEAVDQVVVTGIPDVSIGDLVTAVVVLRAGKKATAAEFCDFVANKVADSNRLRGGVIFVDKLPFTATHKIDIKEVKNIALTVQREF